MSDLFDRAQDREQELRDDALAEHFRRSEKRHVDASAERCAVCGVLIPERRRLAVPGVQTCIDCQQAVERFAWKR